MTPTTVQTQLSNGRADDERTDQVRFARILCLVEFSDLGYRAVQYADSLAMRYGAALTLLHVAPAEQLQLAAARPDSNLLLGFSGGRHRSVRFAEASFPGENLASEALRFARKERSDLIVLPARQRGRVRRLLPLRPPLAAVLAQARCPILVCARVNGAAHNDPRPVLCAVDLEASSRPVVAYAANLARGLNAPLTLICATRERHEDLVDENWRLTAHGRLGQEILRLQQDCGADGEVILEPGELPEAVARAAQRLDAGLLVVGRRPPRGITERLRGYVPELFWNAPCPVLTPALHA